MRWDSATAATRPAYLHPVSAVSLLNIISHTLGPAYEEFSNSAIRKAASLTFLSRSMTSTGTIPVEQKSVHWL